MSLPLGMPIATHCLTTVNANRALCLQMSCRFFCAEEDLPNICHLSKWHSPLQQPGKVDVTISLRVKDEETEAQIENDLTGVVLWLECGQPGLDQSSDLGLQFILLPT